MRSCDSTARSTQVAKLGFDDFLLRQDPCLSEGARRLVGRTSHPILSYEPEEFIKVETKFGKALVSGNELDIDNVGNGKASNGTGDCA